MLEPQMNPQTALAGNLISKAEYETLNEFFGKIHRATINGEQWVETSDEIIRHYNKNGLGKAGYFHFQNIMVCPYGQKEKLIQGLSRQLGEIIYGASEAKVNLTVNTTPVTTAQPT